MSKETIEGLIYIGISLIFLIYLIILYYYKQNKKDKKIEALRGNYVKAIIRKEKLADVEIEGYLYLNEDMEYNIKNKKTYKITNFKNSYYFTKEQLHYIFLKERKQ